MPKHRTQEACHFDLFLKVTTLERHFGFSSSETGLIMAANDVGFLIVILFVSHAATKVSLLTLMTSSPGMDGQTDRQKDGQEED